MNDIGKTAKERYEYDAKQAAEGAKPRGLGGAVIGVLATWFRGVISELIDKYKPEIITDVKKEVALKSIDPDMFQTEEIKNSVIKLKEALKYSPEDTSGLAGDLLDVVIGKASKVQFQAITGKSVDDKMPLSNALFTQMAIVTDVCLLANILSIIGQCIPFTQLTDLGREIRSYLDYSGLTQITGFGYGMMLSAALAPKITQEIDSKMRNTPLDPRSLITLHHREYLTYDEFKEQMYIKGYNDTRIELLLNEAQYFPSPADVILWAAREIFEPEIRAKLRLDDKIPPEFLVYASKAGMTEEMAKNYWAQHWVFPGFTTIQEMRWRNIITDADVDIFFTEADIVPYWREAMLKVMYSPYTRVDARRMFETDILTRDEFKTAMTDIGYTEERAEGLAKWASARKLAPQKDLTISKIEKAFREGEITETNYTERIKLMGYDENEATLMLNLLKRDIEEVEEKDNVDWYILRFKNGLIGLTELETFLNGLGFGEAKKNKLILKAKIAKGKLAKTASKSDLDLWFTQGIIDEPEYKTRLEGLGYENGDISNYVLSIAK